jgi:hypothetical protein
MNWIIDHSRAPLKHKSAPWENGIFLRISPQWGGGGGGVTSQSTQLWFPLAEFPAA